MMFLFFLLNKDIKICFLCLFYLLQNRCRAHGSEALPEGIVVTSSNLNMRPLWGFPEVKIVLKNL